MVRGRRKLAAAHGKAPEHGEDYSGNEGKDTYSDKGPVPVQGHRMASNPFCLQALYMSLYDQMPRHPPGVHLYTCRNLYRKFNELGK
mmetsp:Transcript_87642/g.256220  ORF Transcript_87642/g.256220 Transcript_87642/m.256220 type:complete len:87 (-) Transcript_87642:80-340(-)